LAGALVHSSALLRQIGSGCVCIEQTEGYGAEGSSRPGIAHSAQTETHHSCHCLVRGKQIADLVKLLHAVGGVGTGKGAVDVLIRILLTVKAVQAGEELARLSRVPYQ
jgi:hypothetical protein